MAHKIGLHNHTSHILGSNSEVETRIVRKLVRNSFESKFDAIAFTDADSERNWFRLLDSRNKDGFVGVRYELEKVLTGENVVLLRDSKTEQGLYVIKGIEMHGQNTSYSKHVLAIGYDGSLKGRYEELGLEGRLRLSNELGGLVIAPHPVFCWGIGEENLRRFRSLIHAMEFNAKVRLRGSGSIYQNISEFLFNKEECNDEAELLAGELGMPFIASADSNSGQVNLAYTVLKKDPSEHQRENGRAYIGYLKTEIQKGPEGFDISKGYISPISFLRDFWRIGLPILAKLGKM